MLKKINYSKLAIVLFLTILIWFWADRALEEQDTIQAATIVVKRTRPDLWVSFPDGSVVDINEITLSGPSSIIAELQREINNDPLKREFSLFPEQLGIDNAGEYTKTIQEIIEQNNWIKKLGLSVEKCDPEKVQVRAVELVKRDDLEVQCYDENEQPINLEIPKKVSMYVPADWGRSASVILTKDERIRAMDQTVSKKPFIILSNNEKIEADMLVDIKLPPQENRLELVSISNVTLGLTLSLNLLGGQYIIQVEENSLRKIINMQIYATPAAKEAYENQDYQVTLEILDKHIQESANDEYTREKISYNLPEEYVRKGEIKSPDNKLEVKFKVIPVETEEEPL